MQPRQIETERSEMNKIDAEFLASIREVLKEYDPVLKAMYDPGPTVFDCPVCHGYRPAGCDPCMSCAGQGKIRVTEQGDVVNNVPLKRDSCWIVVDLESGKLDGFFNSAGLAQRSREEWRAKRGHDRIVIAQVRFGVEREGTDINSSNRCELLCGIPIQNSLWEMDPND